MDQERQLDTSEPDLRAVESGPPLAEHVEPGSGPAHALAAIALWVVILFLWGCGERVAEIESTTSWSGSFGGRTVDGRGTRSVDMGDSECLTVQKQTTDGDLRVRIVNEGGLFLFWDSSTSWKSTSAAYGLVSICNDE